MMLVTNAAAANEAREHCLGRIEHFKSKADHNKSETLLLFTVLLLSTLAAPLLIALGPGVLFGKVLPSVLSSVSSGCAIWLQLRKPQQLWTLYRTAQRRLEAEEIGYRFGVNGYDQAPAPAKLLAQRTAQICTTTNDLWAPLVPNPENFLSSLQTESARPASTKHLKSTQVSAVETE